MRSIQDRTAESGLARLKYLLAQGFVREYWSFENVLDTAAETLTDDEMAFYRALADAVLDADKVSALDGFAQWRTVEPIPITEPWDMQA